ncbi:MAG: hypothetical protein LC662_00475 [Rhodothermaceae bacterium]|nr:hypothetical protein [Rhodothermaceae bacterium]
MHKSLHSIILAYLILTLSVLTAVAQLPPQIEDREAFTDYWYSGVAEITRYNLVQNHYGEDREGDAVLIFVTEDFLTGKQVKLETPADGREYVSVLKLNTVKKFVTGIYDYSMMSSVFTPIPVQNWPRSLKATASVQEWCGQTYSQLNFMNNRYRVRSYSYFEDDGDVATYLPNRMLEEEIWTRLRLSPELLPEGAFEIIPSGFDVRTAHREWRVLEATGERNAYTGDVFQGDDLQAYTLNYTTAGRTLTIIYEAAFPHQIAGWEETRTSTRGTTLSRAIKTDQVRSPYWQQNRVADDYLREDLGLE